MSETHNGVKYAFPLNLLSPTDCLLWDSRLHPLPEQSGGVFGGDKMEGFHFQNLSGQPEEEGGGLFMSRGPLHSQEFSGQPIHFLPPKSQALTLLICSALMVEILYKNDHDYFSRVPCVFVDVANFRNCRPPKSPLRASLHVFAMPSFVSYVLHTGRSGMCVLVSGGVGLSGQIRSSKKREE